MLATMSFYALNVGSGADNNVPAWHSRELVDVLQTWNPQANITSVFIRIAFELS